MKKVPSKKKKQNKTKQKTKTKKGGYVRFSFLTFTLLMHICMWEILHVSQLFKREMFMMREIFQNFLCLEGERNSVQVGESLSMQES